MKDMRRRSRPAPVWTQGTGAGSPRPEPTWRTDRRPCILQDGRPPAGSSPHNRTSPRAPEGGTAAGPQAQTATTFIDQLIRKNQESGDILSFTIRADLLSGIIKRVLHSSSVPFIDLHWFLIDSPLKHKDDRFIITVTFSVPTLVLKL